MSDFVFTLTNDFGVISYYRNDRYFIKALQGGKFFDQDLVTGHLKDIIAKSEVIVDAGAHAGSHTILYKSVNPTAEIHAFEPQVKLFELLKHNVTKNKLSNVYLYNQALANISAVVRLSDVVIDNDQTYEISYGTFNETNLGGVTLGHNGELVQTSAIDDLNLTICDFIKLDLEGSESLALLGGKSTITSYHPIILFEYNDKTLPLSVWNTFNEKPIAPANLLTEWGYTIEKLPIGSNYLATWGGQ